jgi:hypothetical protein
MVWFGAAERRGRWIVGALGYYEGPVPANASKYRVMFCDGNGCGVMGFEKWDGSGEEFFEKWQEKVVVGRELQAARQLSEGRSLGHLR